MQRGTCRLSVLEQLHSPVVSLATPCAQARGISRQFPSIIAARLKVLFRSGYTQNAIVHGGRLDPGELLSKPYSRQ